MTTEWHGVLYPAGLPNFHRLAAPEPVGELVRWFWIPEWDIAPGRISRQELIAFPACNLVVEPTFVGLAGPTTRRSFRDLSGRGWAVGALLRPAAVPHFTTDPAQLRDNYVRLDLPELHRRVAQAMTIGDAASDVRRAAAVDEFTTWITDRLPRPDEQARLANVMADLIDSDPSVIRLDDVAALLSVSTRTLQRLAVKYVGLSPAAMIRRRRLQEAAQRIRERPGTDLARIAAELGYTDQAHLTNDFRTVLGFTPSRYRNRAGEGAADPSAEPT